jgi:hypothetical protein
MMVLTHQTFFILEIEVGILVFMLIKFVKFIWYCEVILAQTKVSTCTIITNVISTLG